MTDPQYHLLREIVQAMREGRTLPSPVSEQRHASIVVLQRDGFVRQLDSGRYEATAKGIWRFRTRELSALSALYHEVEEREFQLSIRKQAV